MKRYRLPESVRATRRTDRNLEECLWTIMCPLTMALLILAVLMLGGCAKTVYVPVETVAVRNDSAYKAVYIDRLIIERDTVKISVNATVNENGDTTRTDTNKETTKWRERNTETHDTIVQSRTDSIEVPKPYPVEVVREVEKKMHWWQTALMWTGIASLIGICIAAWWLSCRHSNRTL